MEEITKQISNMSLTKLLPAIIAFVVGMIAVNLLRKLFDKAMGRTKIDRSLMSILRTIMTVLLYAILALVVFGTLGFNVSSLVAILSVVSLAISLAVQGLLSNIAGGIMLLTTHPFRLGEYVKIGDVEGTVNSIRLVHTVLTTVDNKDVFVPNSDVSASRIVNYSAEGTRRLDLELGLSYDADYEVCKAALLELVEGEKIESTPEPFVGILEYGDSAVQYTLRVWVRTADYWEVYFNLRAKAQKVLAKHGVEITYPHINVHMSK